MASVEQRRRVGSCALCCFVLGACIPKVRRDEPPPPKVRVTQDKYATIVAIDGRQVRGEVFELPPGCHSIVVRYSAKFWIDHGAEGPWMENSSIGAAQRIIRAEKHEYTAGGPIPFAVIMTAGNSYWVTATFTGDEFLPRIVEHSEPGEPARSVTPSDTCVAPQLPTAGSATP